MTTKDIEKIKKVGKMLADKMLARTSMFIKRAELYVVNSSMHQGANWSEKSVEYYYVRRLLPTAAIANPLAGDAETLFGDLIAGEVTGHGLSLCAVEFKRTDKQINDEFEKYLATMDGIGKRPENKKFQCWFHEEHEKLVKLKGCASHFIIYGEQATDVSFKLKFGRYCSEKFNDLNDFRSLLQCSQLELGEYLAGLAEARCSLPDDPKGGEDVITFAKTMIVGKFDELFIYSKNGDCSSAREFMKIFEGWLTIEDQVILRKQMLAVALKRFAKKPTSNQREKLEAAVERAIVVTGMLRNLKAGQATKAARSFAVGGSHRPGGRTSLAYQPEQEAD